MKIYTRIVHKWVGDELVTVEADSYEYDGPVAEAKGGDSGQRDLTPQELAILEAQLRGMNMQMGFEEQVAYPMKERLGADVEGWGSEANAELSASQAGADAAGAFGQQQAALDEDMTSMGINPNDARFQGAKSRMGIQGAAGQAAAMSGARDSRKKEGISMRQSFLTGNPINPNYASNAASMAGQQGNAVRQGNAADSQGWYNATMGAGQLASFASGFADGGEVLRMEAGGYVHRKGIQKMANGGMFTDYASMPMPSRAAGGPEAPSTGDYAMGLGKTAAQNKAVQSFAKPYVQEAMFKAGITDQIPASMTQAMPASEVAVADTALLDAGVTAGATETAAATGAAETAAAATAAETAAATTAAEAAAAAAAAETAAATGAAAATTAGAGLSATGVGALVGIPLMAGAAAGWFGADGGKVTPGSKGIRGGEVDGPGGPKDDLIPAMLSDGEYVMPIGAVKYFGLDRLEKMRQKGLEFEKQMGIGKQTARA